MYLGLAFLLRLTILTKKLNISFEIPFFIIFGLILGPFKGSLLGVLADTLNLLITSTIATWMIEYAIVPVFVVLVSWGLFQTFKLPREWSLTIIIISIAVVFCLLITIYALEITKPNAKSTIKLDSIEKDVSSFFTKEVILGLLIGFMILSLAFFSTFFSLWIKTKKEIYFLITFVFAIILIVIMLARWLWGPFAFVQYYNRFIGVKSNKSREISKYFYIYLTPIILKGLITIPIYTLFLVSLTPVLWKLQKKYARNYQNGWAI
ncbi:ECF transporter S component [Mycoplasma procyoni]|uniref:ECF transporter S component n=1 Tax=Mycoplasma procyoni TaxID=568784 RepID=UPI00197B64CF|nr:ECF transporter S component [Mycoplasma procyoni]MBN3534600.1 ECF transporter S component [Mycoplasma procyoni]